MNTPGIPAGTVRCLRYVGSKVRLAKRLSIICRETGADSFVDVFGGSGAVVMNAGFEKRVYNDLDGDLVAFFRVLSSPDDLEQLKTKLQVLPMSREIFEDYRDIYVSGGNSFSMLQPIERAAAVFYRSSFSFGGKFRSGGFACSLGDRRGVKELKRYFGVLEQLKEIGEFWQTTVIENLDYRRAIESYGKRAETVLYCDPPYFGTEHYYSRDFFRSDHEILAEMLNKAKSAVVVSYYEFDGIRCLYPESDWIYELVPSVKNSSAVCGSGKKFATEIILRKRRARK